MWRPCCWSNITATKSGAPPVVAATSTTDAGSPYDLTELAGEVDLGLVGQASFASISISGAGGRLTSYGVSSDLPAMQALSRAIQDAKEVDAQSLGPVATGGGAPTATSTIVFVLPSRETLTFTLDLDHGLISRGNGTWRPAGDLRALVEAATTRPQ